MFCVDNTTFDSPLGIGGAVSNVKLTIGRQSLIVEIIILTIKFVTSYALAF